MAEYYTSITIKQVRVLYKASEKISISENMFKYLYALAKQGSALARDASMENFRKTISECVGEILYLHLAREKQAEEKTKEDSEKGDNKEEDKPEKTIPMQYKETEDKIHMAFRQLCATHSNKYLKLIRKELEEKPLGALRQRKIEEYQKTKSMT